MNTGTKRIIQLKLGNVANRFANKSCGFANKRKLTEDGFERLMLLALAEAYRDAATSVMNAMCEVWPEVKGIIENNSKKEN
jgi:hypothetical protein